MANRKPLIVNGIQVGEVPNQDDLLLAGGALVKNGVDVGNIKVIPAGYSLIVTGPYQLDGTLQIDGTFLLL